MSGLVAAVAFGRRQYATRTRGGAHLYRVTQYYDSWPFEHDSRIPHGSRSRRRAGTFRTLEPVRLHSTWNTRKPRAAGNRKGEDTCYCAPT